MHTKIFTLTTLAAVIVVLVTLLYDLEAGD